MDVYIENAISDVSRRFEAEIRIKKALISNSVGLYQETTHILICVLQCSWTNDSRSLVGGEDQSHLLEPLIVLWKPW